MRQKAFANDGFAVLLLGDNTHCDVHINEWILPPEDNYIDFGIRIYDARQVKKFGVFIPFNVKEDEIIDLSECMCNEKVARGIFNTICSIKQTGDSPITEIEYNGRKENIIKIRREDISTQKLDEGTILYFDICPMHVLMNQDEAYFRFRLQHKSINNLFSPTKWSIKSLFESPVVKYQYNYVLKVNEVRSLPFEVRCIPDLAKQNIGKIIVTVSTSEKYDVENGGCYKIRQLEEELYSTYVPPHFSCSKVIAYQWLSSNKKHYNFNFTILEELISLQSLIGYAFIVVILSAVGSALWEGIDYLLSLL